MSRFVVDRLVYDREDGLPFSAMTVPTFCGVCKKARVCTYQWYGYDILDALFYEEDSTECTCDSYIQFLEYVSHPLIADVVEEIEEDGWDDGEKETARVFYASMLVPTLRKEAIKSGYIKSDHTGYIKKAELIKMMMGE